MKDKKLQTKRQTKKGFRKLHAKVTASSRRKQRVSATANSDMLDSDVPNASIGRALTIILVLHFVAIGVIYIGIKWNKGQFDDIMPASTSTQAAASNVDLSNVNAGLRTEFVLAGDTYEAFAARHQVDVQELRKVNNNASIHAGKTLSLPAEVIKGASPSVVAALPVSDRPPLPATNNVVNVQPTAAVREAPRAVIVTPNVAADQPVVGAQTYQVQSGDSVWRISNKFKVSQDALMQLNGMSDARQLRSGAILKIPAQ
ncbi:MAG: LysM peptidoglycan-binding domain-containing protein [Rubritalea sp.]|uniref:LysM peptidoglycan-binding domain-containing protein n=1 Tax=Rubritalea sp. TaxID=2109375 RepID=UPI0032423859